MGPTLSQSTWGYVEMTTRTTLGGRMRNYYYFWGYAQMTTRPPGPPPLVVE